MNAKSLGVLTPWGRTTPLAIYQQMAARVKQAQEEGRDVYVVACVIERLSNGNYSYTVTNTPMPGEVAWMAAHEVSQRMEPVSE